MFSRHSIQGLQWRDMSYYRLVKVTEYDCEHPGLDAMSVYMGGAFSRPVTHGSPVISRLRRGSTVIVPDYGLDRYNHEEVYRTTRDRLQGKIEQGWSDKLVIFGASMGAINTLRLAADMAGEVEVSAILADPMLSSNAMKIDARVCAPLLTRLRPGPEMNQISRPLVKGLIPGRPREMWEEEVAKEVEAFERHPTPNVPLVLRNMSDMRDIKLSAYLDFARAILDSQHLDPARLEGVRVAVIRSSVEVTLRKKGAQQDVDRVLAQAERCNIDLEYGYHVAFPERPQEWGGAVDRAMEYVLA